MGILPRLGGRKKAMPSLPITPGCDILKVADRESSTTAEEETRDWAENLLGRKRLLWTQGQLDLYQIDTELTEEEVLLAASAGRNAELAGTSSMTIPIASFAVASVALISGLSNRIPTLPFLIIVLIGYGLFVLAGVFMVIAGVRITRSAGVDAIIKRRSELGTLKRKT